LGKIRTINIKQNNYLWNYKNYNIMGALELKDNLLQYIEKADERLLKVVKAVMESYWEDEVVAYTIDGKPLNKLAYKNELEEALNEIKQGDFTTQEDLEKEAEKW
jgi:mevalonate pyrophosphate decarboxylase